MIKIFKEKKITWTDGMTPMMEARAVKNVDEQECFRIVGAIGDATHWECMKFLRPGITENQVTAHLMKYLYNIPGMEDVEDVIVSSGPNTWPNWRNFSDRIIQPGDIVFMDLAALTWNGYKSCYYRTYCVGKEPSQEQKDTYATALKWLYDSMDAVKVGATTRDIALKWPSAMETWGYEDEDQAAANLWGHGLGLAQYDPPVISRIWSLDHPIEIKEGMTFALETQHGKRFRYGVRIEEMLIVHKNEIEIVSNFPVQADHRGRSDPGLCGSREVGTSSAVATIVIAGRDRGDPSRFARSMDARVKPGHDDRKGLSPPMSRSSSRSTRSSATDPDARRPEGRESRRARARGLADAGRLLPDRRRLSAPDRASRDRRTASRASPTRRCREQRRLSVEIRLKLYEEPIAPEILEPLLAAWRAQRAASGQPGAIRSSALIEDRAGANFAGQFESFLGIDRRSGIPHRRARLLGGAVDLAMRAATWTTTASIPADTAMAVLIQPTVAARASGGGLSETADGQMLISATWGLGSAIAQGEVVPDRIVLSRAGLRAQDRGRPQGSSRDLRPRRHRAAGGAEGARRASRASTPGRR